MRIPAMDRDSDIYGLIWEGDPDPYSAGLVAYITHLDRKTLPAVHRDAANVVRED